MSAFQRKYSSSRGKPYNTMLYSQITPFTAFTFLYLQL